MCLSGNSSSLPLAFLLYWINTKFHNSITSGWSLFTRSLPGILFLSLEDLKNDGSDDPEMEMTPGRFVDHIGDKSEELLKEYETILKKLNGE